MIFLALLLTGPKASKIKQDIPKFLRTGFRLKLELGTVLFVREWRKVNKVSRLKKD